MHAKVAIGHDIGGTRIKAVVVEDEGTVLDQVVRQSLAFAKLGEWAGAFGVAARAMQIC